MRETVGRDQNNQTPTSKVKVAAKDVSSKLSVVKQKKLCFNCLGKHQVFLCKSKKRCRKCNRKHHTTICQSTISNVDSQQPSETAVLYSSARQSQSGVLLKTAISDVCYKDTYTATAILFDEGSQRSFITENLAKELQLPRENTEVIRLSAFGSTSDKTQLIDTSTVYVVTERKQKIPVLIVPTIATPIDNTHISDISGLPYLKGLKLAHPVTEDREFSISLLIGADYYWEIVEDKVIRGKRPTAVKSKVGYLLSGPMISSASSRSVEHIFNVMTSRVPDEMSLERFWKLENLGITNDDKDRKLEDEIRQYQKTSIHFKEGRYIAKLPWKPDPPELPTNYEIVLKRTESTVRRLAKEPDMLRKYGDIITEQERRGFIEKVPEVATKITTRPGHYIPHHPVKKESSTTPIRIVYDCSCRQSQYCPSLNDCLLSTPPVLNELTSIMMRFRIHTYAVTTDIEKAFLHVGLHNDDCDMTRFLWLEDPSNPSSKLITYRFKVVLFGATCSPFMLNATILKHLENNIHVAASHILRRDLYVDNVISSFQDEDYSRNYFKEARALMSDAGMNLRSWTSNSKKLRQDACMENVLDADDVTKVLGLRWEPSVYVLSFAKREIPITHDITKRVILRYSSQIYDPLGLLSPVTVRAKILLQDIWKQKYDWDVPLPAEIQQKWTCIAKDLNRVTGIKFPRKYLQTSPNTGSDNRPTLHIFVDASISSYGAAAFICNEEDSRLIIAKTRVAPLKTLTLPRLELMAALIGARLAEHLKITFPTANVTMWSDSQIVLHWLSTKKQLQRFVTNRVKEIQDLTKQHMWKYCLTNDNPADLLTRGITADKFMANDLWMNGPAWLCDKTRWPTWNTSEKLQVQMVIGELATGSTYSAEIKQTTPYLTNSNIQNIINIQKYGKYKRLLRITAYVRRFVENCKAGRAKANYSHISAKELQAAENLWIRDCQATVYSIEIHQIKTTKISSSLIKQLNLFLDGTGSVRCGGRIHNAPVHDDTKFPYLLPKKHSLTVMIVREVHELQGHAGLNSTIINIRQKFWIPAIRQCVNIIIRRCVTCRKIHGIPYKSPEVPPLPKLRLQEAPPFAITGVDFTGALYIKGSRGIEKAYICLFTCAVTRAVHLEVVSNMSADCFLQSFRRFTSRKSMPSLMVSDNAKTFHMASTYLKTMFESQAVRESLSNTGVDWKFIPERAPWYSGWWERLIGITKQTLKKILGRAMVDPETLQTVVTEIESMLNDRPLTFVSSNIEDPEPLTPAHLLYGRKVRSLPYLGSDVNPLLATTVERNTILKRARNLSRILEQFWSRWKTEYLTALRERHSKPGHNTQTIRVGEVVQGQDDPPRIRWKLATVDSLITGNDGLVRAVKIRMGNGLYATRPIVKLYPLEVLNTDCD